MSNRTDIAMLQFEIAARSGWAAAMIFAGAEVCRAVSEDYRDHYIERDRRLREQAENQRIEFKVRFLREQSLR